jgi:hypothetical protein
MNEWFLEEFGPYGFTLSNTVYDPYNFSPHKRVIHPNGYITRISLTPELANDLRGWGVTYESQVEYYRELIRQELYRQYPKVFKPKDFKPKENLLKFKF